MKKFVIVIAVAGALFGALIGSLLERNYLIKTARLEQMNGKTYCIAYGLGECYEVHEYEFE